MVLHNVNNQTFLGNDMQHSQKYNAMAYLLAQIDFSKEEDSIKRYAEKAVLLPEFVGCWQETGRLSRSMLQRKFKITFQLANDVAEVIEKQLNNVT